MILQARSMQPIGYIETCSISAAKKNPYKKKGPRMGFFIFGKAPTGPL